MRACVRACKRTRAIFHWLIGDRARTNQNNEPQTGSIYLFTFFCRCCCCCVFAFFLHWYEVFYHFAVLFPYLFFYNKSPCGLQLNCTVNMNATNVTVQIKSQITIVCYIVYDMCLESKVEMRFTLQSVQSIDKPHLII